LGRNPGRFGACFLSIFGQFRRNPFALFKRHTFGQLQSLPDVRGFDRSHLCRSHSAPCQCSPASFTAYCYARTLQSCQQHGGGSSLCRHNRRIPARVTRSGHAQSRDFLARIRCSEFFKNRISLHRRRHCCDHGIRRAMCAHWNVGAHDLPCERRASRRFPSLAFDSGLLRHLCPTRELHAQHGHQLLGR
jgi:hypothetical protein